MLFLHFLSIFHPLAAWIATAVDPKNYGSVAGKAIAVGVGGGAGAAGAGAGIGSVWGSAIEAKTRQPELAAEVTRDQWVGFALAEACFFYGLVAGFIAAFAIS